MTATTVFPLEGGCDCRHVRYRMETAPLFVHCCHCRWCQRESGASFALNAMIESDRVTVLGAEPEHVHTPSQSGYGQDIARCPQCRIAVWSHYAGAGPLLRFVRVGTLDEPERLPPDIHIFTASRQPWVIIPPDVPSMPEYYDREQLWPAESLARRRALQPRIDAYLAARRAAEAPTGAPEGRLAVDWVIEPIAEAHIAGFHAALDRVARERRYLALLEAPPLERNAEFVRGNIAGGNAQFVAIAADTVVGWCDVTPMQREVFAHRGVLGMGVVPEYRGRGVGRALVEATLSAARSKGLARIDLEVRADNAAAIGLYRAVGFKVEGVKRDALRLDGARFDLVVMALHLDGGA